MSYVKLFIKSGSRLCSQTSKSWRYSQTISSTCSSRTYHSERGVYGYNANGWNDLQKKTKEDISINFGARSDASNLFRLIEAFRKHGHKCSKINPVPMREPLSVSDIPELNPSNYGLSDSQTFSTSGLLFGTGNGSTSNVADVVNYLKKVYCNSIAVDFSAVEDEAEYEWLVREYEQLAAIEAGDLSADDRRMLAREMLRSQNFDNFLATKFSNVKRYGGEGAEAMMGFFTELFTSANARHNLNEIVIAMPHRGRLNLLTGLLHFPPVAMFRKMKGLPEFPPEQKGAGDVLSHLSTSVILGDAHPVRVILLPNPSHLEATNPVACGKARGRQMSKGTGDYSTQSDSLMGDDVLCVAVHGDAALAGQGVNQEILEMSRLPHYSVGGTVHLTVNNQVGFTTPGDRGRSHRYSSDLGKLVGAPVIHVSGDHPEDLVRATRLAVAYRKKFRKDVFVELHCYRRWGHNELDDPTFTNPKLYSQIHARRNVPDIYSESLVASGILSQEEVVSIVSEHTEWLNNNFKQIETFQPKRENLQEQWSELQEPTSSITYWNTGLPEDVLRYVGAQSVAYPPEFEIHAHLKKHHVEGRIKKLEAGTGIDWGLAEALAVGSLLYQGYNVRISGQDVGRATFSHRHAMLVDQVNNEIYIPLNSMAAQGHCTGKLEMANSPLSEEAVLGFEYGMSIDNPKNLIIWEAQFGDFFNGAQIMLDTYVSSGESKWGLQSALTLLLPHGMDGAGPEHSSCRMERFLQMSDSKESAVDGDDVNWHIVNPTTSAQYFHLLRRQMLRNFRKPLVVVAPKILLRLPAAACSLDAMGPGSHFLPVLPDEGATDFRGVKRVIFTSGKHFYTLQKHAHEAGIKDVAIVRLEQLCPFPTKELQDELSKYPNAKRFIWSQEEHKNCGPWSFVQPRFRNLVGVNLSYAGRVELCQPAVGVASVHHKEAASIIEQTFS